MFDLNPAERRALAGASCLIGLGLLGRVVLAPGPAEFDWQPVAGPGTDLATMEHRVSGALVREERAGTPLAEGERIDPNRAPAEELRRLPGVGPALADAILLERRRRPFVSVDDLARVGGIGEATVRRLAPYLRVSSGPAASPTAGACVPEGGAVDVNRAGRAELETLPGVGPTLADRILEHRRANGPFANLAALTSVVGLGPRSVARIAASACAGKP